MENITKIKELIAQGKTEEALALLMEYAKSKNPEAERQAILLSGQYRQWKRESTLGIQQASSELRRIELGIMHLVDGVEGGSWINQEASLVNAKQKKSPLPLVLLGLLAVVGIAAAVYFLNKSSSTNVATTAINEGRSSSVDVETDDTKKIEIPDKSKKKEDVVEPTSTPAPPVPKAIEKYERVPLAGKIWMAENLNEVTPKSKCYQSNDANCEQFGRLYTFESAKRACKSLGEGWRLPTRADWKALIDPYGGNLNEGGDGHKSYKHLKRGGDTGFNATLSGKSIYFFDNESFAYYDINRIGYYWVDQQDPKEANMAKMYTFRSDDNLVLYESIDKTHYISCRCVHN
ncbi:MAG: FISUMP domain-containing protein [Bacteroidota bacterium]